MPTLLIATRNPHKVEEIRAILGTAFTCLSLKEFPDAPDVIEDARTFAGNATKKSVQLAKWLSAIVAGDVRRRPSSIDPDPLRHLQQGYVLADDSGLEVDALNGGPGVHSARFAALDSGAHGNSTAEENNVKLLGMLQNVPAVKRTGRFRCVLALTPVLPRHNESASAVCAADEFELQTELFEGSCEGRIGFAPRGKGGFGYDPLFFPVGYDQTFSELGEDIKNRLSHRAKALEKLRVKLGG